jgi:predicted ATPase
VAGGSGTRFGKPKQYESLGDRRVIDWSLDVARRQGAKSLELRAAMSLTRLCRRLGRPGEGRRLLAATHGWFTEGHQTPDLREALGLLEAPA